MCDSHRIEPGETRYGEGKTIPMSLSSDATWAGRTAKAVLLFRILVGWAFVSGGVQKFLFPDSLGVGRCAKIVIPWPQGIVPTEDSVHPMGDVIPLIRQAQAIRGRARVW